MTQTAGILWVLSFTFIPTWCFELCLLCPYEIATKTIHFFQQLLTYLHYSEDGNNPQLLSELYPVQLPDNVTPWPSHHCGVQVAKYCPPFISQFSVCTCAPKPWHTDVITTLGEITSSRDLPHRCDPSPISYPTTFSPHSQYKGPGGNKILPSLHHTQESDLNQNCPGGLLSCCALQCFVCKVYSLFTVQARRHSTAFQRSWTAVCSRETLY